MKLKHPFTISRGVRIEIPLVIVEIQENGNTIFSKLNETGVLLND